MFSYLAANVLPSPWGRNADNWLQGRLLPWITLHKHWKDDRKKCHYLIRLEKKILSGEKAAFAICQVCEKYLTVSLELFPDMSLPCFLLMIFLRLHSDSSCYMEYESSSGIAAKHTTKSAWLRSMLETLVSSAFKKPQRARARERARTLGCDALNIAPEYRRRRRNKKREVS